MKAHHILYFHKSLNQGQHNIQSTWISIGVNKRTIYFSFIGSLDPKCFITWCFCEILLNFIMVSYPLNKLNSELGSDLVSF